MTKGGGKITVNTPVFLTDFNGEGYNNQPSFVDENQILFTTNYYATDQIDQTEIAKFDLFDETLTRITYTKESEYSPKKIVDKEEFSCVRVEQDGVSQSLSVYPMDGIGYAKRLLHNTNNIGYYEWINKGTLAIFIVEEPYHNLAIADAQSERRKIILDNIGRSLHASATGELLFVHKQAENDWYVKSYNLLSNKSRTIVKALDGSEDFELLNDGSLLMGSGSTLYRYNPKSNDKEWQPLVDLKSYQIDNITRITSFKNQLVIVDQEVE